MINLVKLQCPNCGANLEVSNDVKQCFCLYCGAKILLSNENEHTYRFVDEAAILHEKNETVKLEQKAKEMEEQQRQQEKQEKAEKKDAAQETRLTIMLFWGIFGFLIIFSTSVGGGNLLLMFLSLIQMGLMITGNILWSSNGDEKTVKIGKKCFIASCALAFLLICIFFAWVIALKKSHGA